MYATAPLAFAVGGGATLLFYTRGVANQRLGHGYLAEPLTNAGSETAKPQTRTVSKAVAAC